MNLAVINRIYMNLHLHLGYHFNLIDARMDDEPQHNHIYLPLRGRGDGRHASLSKGPTAGSNLVSLSFQCGGQGGSGDRPVAASSERRDSPPSGACSEVLIGFTRQLDIQLRSDRDMSQFVEMFFDRHSKFIEQSQVERPGGEHEWRQTENYGVG